MTGNKFYTTPDGKWYHTRSRRFWFAKITGPCDTFHDVWNALGRVDAILTVSADLNAEGKLSG